MIAHAAAESSFGTTPGTHVVVLSAPNEQALLKLSVSLSQDKIPHSAFREPDPPYHNQLMSVGINPLEDRRMVRRYLRAFSMFGGSHE